MLTGRFDASSPGTVHYKQTADSNEQQFVMFRADTDPGQLSAAPAQAISPPGLNGSRQTYLYQHIRDFVADPWKDVMCPRPGTVFPISSDVQPNGCEVVSNSNDDCAAGHADASDKKRRVTVGNRKSDKRVCRRGRVSSQRK